jgi:hypothetical protein
MHAMWYRAIRHAAGRSLPEVWIRTALLQTMQLFRPRQPVPKRIEKKDARNDCTFYELRVSREKETSTPASQRPNDARQAFENLFKK